MPDTAPSPISPATVEGFAGFLASTTWPGSVRLGAVRPAGRSGRWCRCGSVRSRWAPRSGRASAMRRMASRMRAVTALRARSAAVAAQVAGGAVGSGGAAQLGQELFALVGGAFARGRGRRGAARWRARRRVRPAAAGRRPAPRGRGPASAAAVCGAVGGRPPARSSAGTVDPGSGEQGGEVVQALGVAQVARCGPGSWPATCRRRCERAWPSPASGRCSPVARPRSARRAPARSA